MTYKSIQARRGLVYITADGTSRAIYYLLLVTYSRFSIISYITLSASVTDFSYNIYDDVNDNCKITFSDVQTAQYIANGKNAIYNF